MKFRILTRKHIAYIILACSTVYLSGLSYANVASSIVDVIMIFLGFIGCVLLQPQIKIPQTIDANGIFVLCIAIGSILSYIIFHNQNMWLDPLIVLGEIGLAYMIEQRISFRKFAQLYSNLLALLSGIAILILLLNRIGINIPNFEYTGIDGITTYHTIWLCTWSDSAIGQGSVMGPFWEPGLYSSMAIYALLCEGCFTGQKPRKVLMAIVLVGIFLSHSTAGYILAVLALYIIVFQSKAHRMLFDIIALLIILIIFFFSDRIVEVLVRWDPDVFWKIAEQSMTVDTRLYSPIACLQVFLQSPMTGLGMSYATSQYNLYKAVYGMDALTSTSAFMMAAFGVFGIAYTAFLCRGVWRQRRFGFAARVLLLTLFLLIVNKEPHTSILFTYIMMFYLNKSETEERCF